MPAAGAPVISEEKARLARRRFVLAVIGGADPFTPRVIVAAQLALTAMPAALAVLGAVLPLVLSPGLAAAIAGLTAACFFLALHLVLPRVVPQTERVLALVHSDEGTDGGAPAGARDALSFLAFARPLRASLTMAAVGGGAMASATLALPAAAASLPPALGALCATLWWLSVWLSLLPLLFARSALAAGVNVAHVDTSDTSGLARASRALYAGGLSALLLAPTGSIAFGVGGGLLALLPLLWPVGTLPHARVLCSWAAEQWLVCAHGGSACATDERTALALALSWLAALLVVLALSAGPVAGVIVAAGCGQLLALPLFPVSSAAAAGGQAAAAAATALVRGRVPGAVARQLSMLLEFVLAVAGCGGGGAALTRATGGGPRSRAAALAVDCSLALLWAAHAASAQLQRPALLRGLLRPPRALRTPLGLQRLRRAHRALQLPLPLLTSFALCTHLLLAASAAAQPGAAAAAAAAAASAASDGNASRSFGRGGSIVASATFAVLLCRAVRWPWQAPARAAAEATAVLWLRRVAAASTAGTLLAPDDALALVGALALAAFAHDRVRRWCGCVHAQLCMLGSVRSDPKQAFSRHALVLRLSAVCAPLLLLVSALAALLAAPLLPVFGLPLFVVGFPRPARFWPAHGVHIEPALSPKPSATAVAAGARGPQVAKETAAESEEEAMAQADRAAYAQLADELIAVVLPRALADGRLHGGAGGGAGNLFLVRVDEAICVAQVVETGYRHCTLVLRGLERAATSCHNVEGGALDELNERVLGSEEGEWAAVAPAGGARPGAAGAGGRRAASADSDSEGGADGSGDGGGGGAQPLARALALSAYAPLARVRVRAYTIASSQLLGLLNDRERLRWLSDAFAFALVLQIRTRQRAAGKAGLPDEWWHLIADFADPDINAASSAGKPALVAEGRFKRPIVRLADGVGEDGPQPFPYDFDELCCARLGVDASQTAARAQAAPPDGKGAPKASPKVIRLTLWLHAVFDKFGLAAGTAVDAGVGHVLRCFLGQLAPSEQAAALASRLPELLQLAQRAYRHAAKLAVDAAATFAIEDLWDADEGAAVYDALAEMADGAEWHIGPVGSAEWTAAMERKTPRLFGLRKGASSASHGAQLLTLREEQATVGAWSSELVRALWSSQMLELLFAANDDDERYSIQASKALLRNLAVQAAAPPLGYPAYSSRPRLCSLAMPLDAALGRVAGGPRLARSNSLLPLARGSTGAPSGTDRVDGGRGGAAGAHAHGASVAAEDGAPRPALQKAESGDSVLASALPEGDGVMTFERPSAGDSDSDSDAGGSAAREAVQAQAQGAQPAEEAKGAGSAQKPEEQPRAPTGSAAAIARSVAAGVLRKAASCDNPRGGAASYRPAPISFSPVRAQARADEERPIHGGGAPTPHGPGQRLIADSSPPARCGYLAHSAAAARSSSRAAAAASRAEGGEAAVRTVPPPRRPSHPSNDVSSMVDSLLASVSAPHPPQRSASLAAMPSHADSCSLGASFGSQSRYNDRDGLVSIRVTKPQATAERLKLGDSLRDEVPPLGGGPWTALPAHARAARASTESDEAADERSEVASAPDESPEDAAPSPVAARQTTPAAAAPSPRAAAAVCGGVGQGSGVTAGGRAGSCISSGGTVGAIMRADGVRGSWRSSSAGSAPGATTAVARPMPLRRAGSGTSLGSGALQACLGGAQPASSAAGRTLSTGGGNDGDSAGARARPRAATVTAGDVGAPMPTLELASSAAALAALPRQQSSAAWSRGDGARPTESAKGSVQTAPMPSAPPLHAGATSLVGHTGDDNDDLDALLDEVDALVLPD